MRNVIALIPVILAVAWTIAFFPLLARRYNLRGKRRNAVLLIPLVAMLVWNHVSQIG